MITGRRKRGAVAGAIVLCAFSALTATLLCAGTAAAAGTAQQNCDKARLLAWGGYVECMEKAKGVFYGGGGSSATYRKFWQCRHRYVSKWTTLQTRIGLGGSTCSGSRFTNNGPTVTDNLTGLVWEKKDYPIDPTLNDWSAKYTWSSGPPWNGSGDAFSYFLYHLNDDNFDGTKGWRLPTLPELYSIMLDTPCLDSQCSCGTGPCIDPVFGPTQNGWYWSATTFRLNSPFAWIADMSSNGQFNVNDKGLYLYVRAVRGGL
jgi:hypothetical protein